MNTVLLAVSALAFWLLFTIWKKSTWFNFIIKVLLLLLAVVDTIGALVAAGFLAAP